MYFETSVQCFCDKMNPIISLSFSFDRTQSKRLPSTLSRPAGVHGAAESARADFAEFAKIYLRIFWYDRL